MDGESAEFEGTIERTTESADRISRTTLARIAFSGEERTKAEARLKPGMYVREVKRSSSADASPWVPESVLTTRGGLEGAFVLEEGKAKFHWLRTGKRLGGMVEILAGLRGSESLINQPSGNLRDGSPVKVEKRGGAQGDAALTLEGDQK